MARRDCVWKGVRCGTPGPSLYGLTRKMWTGYGCCETGVCSPEDNVEDMCIVLWASKVLYRVWMSRDWTVELPV